MELQLLLFIGVNSKNPNKFWTFFIARFVLKFREELTKLWDSKIRSEEIPLDNSGHTDAVQLLKGLKTKVLEENKILNKPEKPSELGRSVFSDTNLPNRIDYDKLLGPWLEAINHKDMTNNECIVHFFTKPYPIERPVVGEPKKEFIILSTFHRRNEPDVTLFHYKTVYTFSNAKSKLTVRYKDSTTTDSVWILEVGPERVGTDGKSRYEWVILAYEAVVYQILVRNWNDYKKYETNIWDKLAAYNPAIREFRRMNYMQDANYNYCNYTPSVYNGFGLAKNLTSNVRPTKPSPFIEKLKSTKKPLIASTRKTFVHKLSTSGTTYNFITTKMPDLNSTLKMKNRAEENDAKAINNIAKPISHQLSVIQDPDHEEGSGEIMEEFSGEEDFLISGNQSSILITYENVTSRSPETKNQSRTTIKTTVPISVLKS